MIARLNTCEGMSSGGIEEGITSADLSLSFNLEFVFLQSVGETLSEGCSGVSMPERLGTSGWCRARWITCVAYAAEVVNSYVLGCRCFYSPAVFLK